MSVACIFYLTGKVPPSREKQSAPSLVTAPLISQVNCQKLCDESNAHSISGAGGGHSPNVSYLIIDPIKYFTKLS